MQIGHHVTVCATMSGKRKPPPEAFIYDVDDEDEYVDLTKGEQRSIIPPSKPNGTVVDPAETWDYGYDSVNSPSGSSTASGPTYVRPPGFEHHGQEIVIPASSASSSSQQNSAAAALSSSVPSSSRNTPTGDCASGLISPVSVGRKSSINGSKKKKSLLSVDRSKETTKKLDFTHSSTSSKQKTKKGK